MCGIAGVWQAGRPGDDLLREVLGICAALAHRGPDGEGFWCDEDAGLALGHRRLSIIDLSEHGRQPMLSADGRFCITYNGELYNTEELRAPLAAKGVVFRGTSDTEVLVNAIAVHGLEAALRMANGIFAFAVWDRQERVLSLARDRVGVKPLFYARTAGGFAFASEVRALSGFEGFERGLDPAAIGCFLQYNSIRAPLTIYRGARALEAGSFLTLSPSGQVREHRYWDLASVVAEGRDARHRPVSDESVIDHLEELLADSVRRQMVSDVPIGCFLSGGVDSSTIAALMQKASSRPIRTFSIGFEDPALDEATHARDVARSLGTEHRELYVSHQDVLECIPRLASVYDQPLADLSCIPTYLLCKMAREDVTVALSGDGGDELFYGYSRFMAAERAARVIRRVPAPVRRAGAGMANLLGGRQFRTRGFLTPGRVGRMAWHASRLIDFASQDADDAYLHFITHWSDPEQIAPAARGDASRWFRGRLVTPDFRERMMLHDTQTFMAEQVLTKVDRASMAASLEARVPLLDHRVIELAWQLPQGVKYREGRGKWCLRQVLHRHVPRALVERPKSGFRPPLGDWLRGPLSEWCEDLLSKAKIKGGGVFDEGLLSRCWNAQVAGKVDAAPLLWSVLMLQNWLENHNAN